MKRKWLASTLAVAMLFGNFPLGMVETSYAQDDKEAASLEQTSNPILMSFLEQAGDRYKGKDSLTLILGVNDSVMAQKYKLTVPKIENIKTEEGLLAQIAYAKKAQNILIKQMDSLDIDYTVGERYDTLLTGLSVQTTYEDALKIANLQEIGTIEIDNVIPRPIAKPFEPIQTLDTSSNKMIQAPTVWNSQYTGKGQLIAIIDSGANPNHEVFQTIPDDGLKIASKEALESLKRGRNIAVSGHFFSKKIPYGYNYADHTIGIKESTNASHGMHVAGITAANSEKLKGVAPDAQLAIMRVFGEAGLFGGGGTTHEIYNKAIDDAVKLGVDSINMSLGTTSTSTNRVEPSTINALMDAKRAGIAVSIAAGNEGFMGYDQESGPKAANPDYGMLSSPAVAEVSLAVASVNNTEFDQPIMKVTLANGTAGKSIGYVASTSPKELPETDVEFVDCGWGYPEEFTGKNIRGKYALVQRGGKDGSEPLTFGEKVKNAENSGAAGVIVYNNTANTDIFSMAGLEDRNIPACFIQQAGGQYLIANPTAKVSFSKSKETVENPDGYKVSSFSSWGVSPEGDLKPDISAPGSGILSSLNNDYGRMNGTSMAAPHVAGGIAIAKQYIEKNFPQITGEEKHVFVKNLLMSTARPHIDAQSNAYISPRSQGAGLMNLASAIKSSVTIEGTNRIASINLRNLSSNTVTVEGTLKNYGQTSQSFSYYAYLTTDSVEDGKTLLRPQALANTKNAKKTITVPAGSSQTFSVTISVPADKISDLETTMPNGYFLEGYVFFESTGHTNADLSVPFVGFKGSWEDLSVIEDSIYDFSSTTDRPYYYKYTGTGAYPFTHIQTKEGGRPAALGELGDSTIETPKFDKNKIAFSPNGDGKGDEVSFVGTFLRNYRDFNFSIFKKDDTDFDHPLYESKSEDWGRKNFYTSSNLAIAPNYVTTKTNWKWDGIDGESGLRAPEGDYVIRVDVKPDDPRINTVQRKLFPLKLDVTLPRIVKSHYNEATREFTIDELEEKGSGVKTITFMAGNEEKVFTGEGPYTFKLPDGMSLERASVKLVDMASNMVSYSLNNAIRSGNERGIAVSPKVNVGNITTDKFTYYVLDENGRNADPYNLAIGKYTLVIDRVDDSFELVGNPRIPFEIKAEDTLKVVDVNFISKEKASVEIIVNNKKKVDFSLILVDKATGKEYSFPYQANKEHMKMQVPKGDYKIRVTGLDTENYFATLSTDNVKALYDLALEFPTVTIESKSPVDITLELKRNNYAGKVDVFLQGQDTEGISQVVSFEANETTKRVNILKKLKYDIYATNFSQEGYGSTRQTYSYRSMAPKVTVELVNGAPVETNKPKRDLLGLKIKQADAVIEADVIKGLDEFKAALSQAKAAYAKESSTQSEVNKALDDLSKAMEKMLVVAWTDYGDKRGLVNQYLESLAIYNSLPNDNTYMKTTVTALRDALDEAERVIASSRFIDNETNKLAQTIKLLKDAQNGLRRIDGRVDLTGLKQAVNEAKIYYENKDEFTTESLEAFIDCYEEALEIITQDDGVGDIYSIGSLTENLKDFTKALVSKADKTALKQAIVQAEAIDLSEYEEAGQAEFKRALVTAKATRDNTRSFRSAVEEATSALTLAMGNLHKAANPLPNPPTPPTPPNPQDPQNPSQPAENLEQLITQVKDQLDGSSTRESQVELELALKAAEEVVSDAKASEALKEQAKEALKKANDKRIQKPVDKTLLQTLTEVLNEAINLDSPTLTGGVLTGSDIDSGLEALKANYAAVKAILDNQNASQEMVQNAYESLLSAYDALVVKVGKVKPEITTPVVLDKAIEGLEPYEKAKVDKVLDLKEVLKGLTNEQKAQLTTIDKLNQLVEEANNTLIQAKEEVVNKVLETLPTKDTVKKENLTALQYAKLLIKDMPNKENQVKLIDEMLEKLAKEAQNPSQPGNSGGGGGGGGGGYIAPPKNDNKDDNKEVKKDQGKPQTGVQAPALSDKPYMSGYQGNLFKPNQAMTRAEVAAVLARFADGPTTTRYFHFKDVKNDAWYQNALQTLANRHVISGYEDDTFMPNKAVTRAEFVSMLARLKGIDKVERYASFSDLKDAAWAKQAVSIALENGWVNGYKDNTFRPNQAVSRAEVAAILAKAYKVEKSGNKTFSDVPQSHWAYQAISQMTN